MARGVCRPVGSVVICQQIQIMLWMAPRPEKAAASQDTKSVKIHLVSRTHISLNLTWSIHQDRHILSNKTHLKSTRTEIIQRLLSDHRGIKLEINNREIIRKSPNIQGVKKTCF